MNCMVRTLLVALCMIACVARCVPQEERANHNYILQKFSYWGTLNSDVAKIIFYAGFTNGFFVGASNRGAIQMSHCIEKNIDPNQAVAMIDKYYLDHPERWNVPLAIPLFEALTVKGGPCSDVHVWSD